VKNRDRLVSALGRRVREMNAQHWIDRLETASVPCGLVRTVSEVLDSTDADPRTGLRPSIPGSV